jgi:hypothetical protein
MWKTYTYRHHQSQQVVSAKKNQRGTRDLFFGNKKQFHKDVTMPVKTPWLKFIIMATMCTLRKLSLASTPDEDD